MTKLLSKRQQRKKRIDCYACVNPIAAIRLGLGLGGETITTLGSAAMVVILSGGGLLAFSRVRKTP